MSAMYGPIARIILRYGVGALAGYAVGNQLAGDPDIVLIVAGGIGAAIEGLYVIARRKGWAT